MRSFKTVNIIAGWIAFAVAAVTYLMCLEPTASLWDCGEFISAAYKLEVGHPPGAPLFLMMARIFSLFAPSVDKVAVMINSMSALASAFTILFLFWTITHLFCKMVGKKGEELSSVERIVAIGAGMVGALAYAFSDTFWYSAVEAEVYATSSLFTAVVFWAILKWENVADEPYANRWLVLIFYLLGLSIGVHLLNLLAIPAIVMVYYFKKYKTSLRGAVVAFLLSLLILAGVLYGVVPLIPLFASWVELLFVNSFGLPINSGLLVFVMLLSGALIYFVYHTAKRRKVLLNTIALSLAFLSLGYATYGMIVIRSSANPPMDQNNPDNMFSLMSYLNREQYGSRPLVHGNYYNTPKIDYDVKETYVRIGNRYEKANEMISYVYDPRYTTIFPRMYSDSPEAKEHQMAYMQWVGAPKGKEIKDRNGTVLRDEDGNAERIPTFGQNLKFFFSYQVNWMYWRYFMWNFSGRQNDLQGHGGPIKGNWVTGIKPLDEVRLGRQDREELPEMLANNKAHNVYYMLPLLLGLLGMVAHFSMNRKDFSIVMLLFLFTGFAIIVYLNQTPYQPRERDYAYAGSFYAFAIWIGLGVVGVYALLHKLLKPQPAGIAAFAVCMGIPVLMAAQNWDDHDRSGRFIASDFGYNMLHSCLPNSVLITYGDNDTFSAWYGQEVEGTRTDVRVANISYLYSDWYYEQMMRKVYESDMLITSATPEKVAGSRRNAVPVARRVSGVVELKSAMDFIMNDDPRAKMQTQYDIKPINTFPTDSLVLACDIPMLKKTGVVSDTIADENVGKYMLIKLRQSVYGKNNVAIFDFMANNFNNRPMHFGVVTPTKSWEEFKGYSHRVGLADLVTPTPNPTRTDTERTYDLYMNTFRYRGLNDPNVYADETYMRMVAHYRTGLIELAEALLAEGKNDKVVQALDKAVEALPELMDPYYVYVIPIVRLYAQTGEHEKAQQLAKKVLVELQKELKLYTSFDIERLYMIGYEFSAAIQGMSSLAEIMERNKYEDLAKEAKSTLMLYQGLIEAMFR